jgi:dTDP-4-amino-4,6-dideoxygalactose transaminase
VATIATEGILHFPFLDLTAQYATIRNDVQQAVLRVLDSQKFILGEEVELFENEFSEFISCQWAIGCASGTDALLLALMALGVGEGDEVITTPFTFVATAGCIARLRARPVFVDIEPGTYNIDASQIEEAITTKTRAIIPVHLFGLPADMTEILAVAERHGLAVIEDAAQAIGATYRNERVGHMGDIGCFSFFPSKNLGGVGDGGILATNDAAVADRLRLLRVHGSRQRYKYELLGINSRLDAIQAAVLRVKLHHLEEWTAARRRRADRYRALLREYEMEPLVFVQDEPEGRLSVYNQFVIRVPDRDRLRLYLADRGVPTEIYYPFPLHTQEAFAYLGHGEGDFPEAERASREALALPVYPELPMWYQRTVIKAMHRFYKESN